MPKLTLSADQDVIEQAKQLAEARGTSVSAMFSQFVRASAKQARTRKQPLAPITRRVAGLARLPAGKSYRALIEQAIAEKHR